ncbi:hypothetical protein B0H14DRAFT_2645593 [Mycena olivaceomarginata]|nr:hypothetical protein B0H14DRAFT_2645593 [Mycena olivaceomarginata]
MPTVARKTTVSNQNHIKSCKGSNKREEMGGLFVGNQMSALKTRARVRQLAGSTANLYYTGTSMDFKVYEQIIKSNWSTYLINTQSVIQCGVYKLLVGLALSYTLTGMKSSLPQVVKSINTYNAQSVHLVTYVLKPNANATLVYALYSRNQCYYPVIIVFKKEKGPNYVIYFPEDKVYFRSIAILRSESQQRGRAPREYGIDCVHRAL